MLQLPRRCSACERHTLAAAAVATAERGAPAPSCGHGPSRDPSVGLELARRGLPSHRRGVLWHPTYAAPTAMLVPADVAESDLAGLDTLRHDVGSRCAASAARLRARVRCGGRLSALGGQAVQAGRCRSCGWRRRGRCGAGRERRRRDVSVAPLGVAWLAAAVEHLPLECGGCCCCCAQWARSSPTDAVVDQSWPRCLCQASPKVASEALPVRLGAAVARRGAGGLLRRHVVRHFYPNFAFRKSLQSACSVWGLGRVREARSPRRRRARLANPQGQCGTSSSSRNRTTGAGRGIE